VLLAAPKAGVLVAAPNAGVLLVAAPNAGVLLAPNAGVLLGAPNAGVLLGVPKAGEEPNEKVLALDAGAPKAGALLAPKAGAVLPPNEKAMAQPHKKTTNGMYVKLSIDQTFQRVYALLQTELVTSQRIPASGHTDRCTFSHSASGTSGLNTTGCLQRATKLGLQKLTCHMSVLLL
jgi:hypothetical protein